MFDLEASLKEQLENLRNSGLNRPIIVFPEALDVRIVEAASALVQMARVVLLGKRSDVSTVIDYQPEILRCSRDLFFEEVKIVDPAESPLIPQLATALQNASKGRKWEMDEPAALAKVKEPVFFAAMLVREGLADGCLGGVVHATKDFLAPCLRLIKSSSTAFEMGLFVLPQTGKEVWRENIVMFADVALNINPTAEQLADIAVESCKTLRDIVPESVLPEVNGAMISYSTKGSGQGPTVTVIREAEPLAQEKLLLLQQRDNRCNSITINGELQVSVAISMEAAEVKLKDRLEEFHGAGQANVLIVPLLDQGNMLYHLFSTQYPDATSSLVMGGMDGQVLDYSRGSTVEQVILGAKLLLLTRMKAERELASDSPLYPACRVLAISSNEQAALFAEEKLIAKSDSLDSGSLIELFESAGFSPEKLSVITTDSLAGDSKERLHLANGDSGVPSTLGKAFGIPVLVHELPSPPPTHLTMQYLVATASKIKGKSSKELNLLIAEIDEQILYIGGWRYGRWLEFQQLPIVNHPIEMSSANEEKFSELVIGTTSHLTARLPEFGADGIDAVIICGKMCNNQHISGKVEEIFHSLCIETLVFPGGFALEALYNDGRRFCTSGTLS